MGNSIKYYSDKSRINKKGHSPLMLRVIYKNDRKQFSTGITVPADKWDGKKDKVKG